MASAKLIAALEAAVAALKEEAGVTAAAPALRGNRTHPVTNYNGGDNDQNLVDCVRRAVRKSRQGIALTKKERNVMRQCIKDFKEDYDILNTNGRDVFTINGCGA